MMNNSKRIACLSALVTALNFVSLFSASATVSVVSYWRFGEQDPGAAAGMTATATLDGVGTNNLSLSNNVAYSADVSSNAASEVGSTLCLQFPAGSFGACPIVITNQDNFGIELWVNSASTSGNQCLAYNGNTSFSGWGLYQLGANYGGLFGGVEIIYGSVPVTVGLWTHLALVRDNGATTIYVNGAAMVTTTSTPNFPMGGFGVAAPPLNTGQEQFAGSLDEVRVFTFAPGQFSTNDLLINQGLSKPPRPAPDWHFVLTGSMFDERRLEPAVLLPNGQVLVAGGQTTANPTVAELYDQATGQWTNTAPLNIDRDGATATLLTNGDVLEAGGYSVAAGPLNTAEIYAPGTATWTNTGLMVAAQYSHRAALLTNGDVLIAGGADTNSDTTATCQLYDPSARAWRATGSLSNGRIDHAMTVLADGRVLVAGGQGEEGDSLTSVEIYNPATGVWSNAAPLNVAREYFTVTLLTNGQVLAAGGGVATGEVYDPAGNTWALTGDISYAPFGHTATLLHNGQVLITGGLEDSYTSYTNTALYDPIAQTWTSSAPLHIGRRYHQAALLPDGQVLIMGGDLGLTLSSTAELFVAPESASPLLSILGPAGGSVQLSFTNSPSALFNVLASPDLTQPRTNWTVLGNAIEGPAGHYQWTDPLGMNGQAKFYILRNQ